MYGTCRSELISKPRLGSKLNYWKPSLLWVAPNYRLDQLPVHAHSPLIKNSRFVSVSRHHNEIDLLQTYAKDPYTHGKGVTLGFGFTSLQMLEKVVSVVKEAEFPFLILQCDNDPITPVSGANLMFTTSKTPQNLKALNIYKNCFHSPLTSGSEASKSKADTLAWVKSRVLEHQTK